MKKHCIESVYVYEGFGFPVVLHNVPMRNVRGVWTPDIKWNRLEKYVLLLLAQHPVGLSGNQIRFIRHSMEMSQREFSELFGITHAAVVKWEKSYEKPAKMQITTQIAIRLQILDNLIKDDKDFRAAYHNIKSLAFQSADLPLEIDTQTDLIAI